MWKQLFDLFKLVFTFAEELRKVQADVKEINQQIRELTANQSRLYYELQMQREREAHEREKQALRLENQQLRSRLELPPVSPDKKTDD